MRHGGPTQALMGQSQAMCLLPVSINNLTHLCVYLQNYWFIEPNFGCSGDTKRFKNSHVHSDDFLNWSCTWSSKNRFRVPWTSQNPIKIPSPEFDLDLGRGQWREIDKHSVQKRSKCMFLGPSGGDLGSRSRLNSSAQNQTGVLSLFGWNQVPTRVFSNLIP